MIGDERPYRPNRVRLDPFRRQAQIRHRIVDLRLVITKDYLH